MKKISLSTLIGLFLLTHFSVFAQSVSLDPQIKTAETLGGGVSISVTANGAWTAKSSAGWIDVQAGFDSGVGNGRVVYLIDRNTTADIREGYIQVGDAKHTVAQKGLTGEISPSFALLNSSGGSGSVNIIVMAGTEWTAVAKPEPKT